MEKSGSVPQGGTREQAPSDPYFAAILSADVLQHVFHHLDVPSLARAQLVCRTFLDAAREPSLLRTVEAWTPQGVSPWEWVVNSFGVRKEIFTNWLEGCRTSATEMVQQPRQLAPEDLDRHSQRGSKHGKAIGEDLGALLNLGSRQKKKVGDIGKFLGSIVEMSFSKAKAEMTCVPRINSEKARDLLIALLHNSLNTDPIAMRYRCQFTQTISLDLYEASNGKLYDKQALASRGSAGQVLLDDGTTVALNDQTQVCPAFGIRLLLSCRQLYLLNKLVAEHSASIPDDPSHVALDMVRERLSTDIAEAKQEWIRLYMECQKRLALHLRYNGDQETYRRCTELLVRISGQIEEAEFGDRPVAFASFVALHRFKKQLVNE